MEATVYHLEARAPFHFGLRGVGIEATGQHAPSDTLFSALCAAIRQLYGSAMLVGFLEECHGHDPPVLLSSAFPYGFTRGEGEGERRDPDVPLDPSRAVCFFPRPMEPPPGVPDLPAERKAVKKIAWVSEGVFRGWVGGEDLKPHFAPERLIHGGQVWLTDPELASLSGWRDEETDEVVLWVTGDVPRVTVDRGTSTSSVYQAGRVWFRPGGGLWMLARWREDWRERGELALQALGDEGIGGERSAGHGLFRLHGPRTLPPLPDPSSGGRFVALSLYYPAVQELSAVLGGDGVGYRFQVRRGWMASPDWVEADGSEATRGGALRRKAVRMFAEGSVLRWPEGKAFLGTLADVTPDVFTAHKVYRYGLAAPVGYRPFGGGP